MNNSSTSEGGQRSAQVERAIASVRLEGLEPAAEAKEIFDLYAKGGITISEMGARVRELNPRQYGPVPVSGLTSFEIFWIFEMRTVLADFEANATAARLIELDAKAVSGDFDIEHVKEIHRTLFQDVDPWAGVGAAFNRIRFTGGR